MNVSSESPVPLHDEFVPNVTIYVVGFKCLRPDIQKPRHMENAASDIVQRHLW